MIPYPLGRNIRQNFGNSMDESTHFGSGWINHSVIEMERNTKNRHWRPAVWRTSSGQFLLDQALR